MIENCQRQIFRRWQNLIYYKFCYIIYVTKDETAKFIRDALRNAMNDGGEDFDYELKEKTNYENHPIRSEILCPLYGG